jgi:two-component sensor histidine kinase
VAYLALDKLGVCHRNDAGVRDASPICCKRHPAANDAWLSGEVEVLCDIAERTPKDRLYCRVVGEVAEPASHEVPNRQRSSGDENDAVFFFKQETADRPNSGLALEMEPQTSLPYVLTEFLNTSLDVAEAKADALRLSRTEVDLDKLVRGMIDLYEPSMSEKGLGIQIRSAGSVKVSADPALLHRVIANLLDNELKHLPASCLVCVSLRADDHMATLTVEDNGPGFDAEISRHLFERRVKGRASRGNGLGLAFVEAVVRVHGGSVTAINRHEGGARLTITLPSARLRSKRSFTPLLS